MYSNSKMMKSQNLFYLLLLSILLFSCSTDEITESSSNITTSNIRSNTVSDIIIAKVESSLKQITDTRSLPSDSVLTYQLSTQTLTVALRDTVSFPVLKRFPKTVVIDFGTGYTSDVYSLNGKLVVYTKDTLGMVAYSKKIIYDDFYFDNNHLIGSKTVIYKGTFAKGTTNVSDSTYYILSSKDTINSNGAQSVCNSYYTRKCIHLGGDTIKYVSTGYAGGVTENNSKYAAAIVSTQPLIRYSTYPYVISGGMRMTFEDHTFTFDYGDGTTNDTGIITYINSKTKTISLK